MRLKSSKNNHIKIGLLKRLGLVAAIIATVIICIQIISYATRPQISYSLKEADCSSSAINARNEAIKADLKSCVLVISAQNTQNKSVYVDYDGVGGGPIGGRSPLIKLHSANGKFCYALLAGQGASFEPRATNELTLRCGLVQNPQKNYDTTSDINPISIEIDDYSKKTINVDPVR